MSALDTLSRVVSPDSVRVALRQSPEYVVNRKRAGALLHDGFSAMDTYKSLKPALFLGSLLGMAGSGYGFAKRKNPEARVLYGGLFALCAAMAWFTRPGGTPPTDASPEEVAADPGAASTVGWIDQRVAALQEANPNFDDEAFNRLVQMPGIKTQFQQMNPIIQAAVI